MQAIDNASSLKQFSYNTCAVTLRFYLMRIEIYVHVEAHFSNHNKCAGAGQNDTATK